MSDDPTRQQQTGYRPIMPQGDFPAQGSPQWQGQPAYAPQPPMQPEPQWREGSGDRVAAAYSSRALRKGIGSVILATLGCLVVIGPLIAIFKGLSAVIRGILELIRSAFSDRFGRGAAFAGILLGLAGIALGLYTGFHIVRGIGACVSAYTSGHTINFTEPGQVWELACTGEVPEECLESFDPVQQISDTVGGYVDSLATG